jgi:hypothetical protein
MFVACQVEAVREGSRLSCPRGVSDGYTKAQLKFTYNVAKRSVLSKALS